jgi:hypothetical protein
MSVQQLKTQITGCRLSINKLGLTRALNGVQVHKAAETFKAEQKMLIARKKLLDPKHEAYQKVTHIINAATQTWRYYTMPYPEPGLRLAPKAHIEALNQELAQCTEKLHIALNELQQHYHDILTQAQTKLGTLFNPHDYPENIKAQFAITWQFCNVEPPIDLQQLTPNIYEQEKAKAEAKLQEAIELTQQAFAAELSQLVSHLIDKLTPGPEGEKKVFRDTAITNLTDFIQRFKMLKCTESPQLDELIEQVAGLTKNISPKELRKDEALKEHLKTQMQQLTNALEPMIAKAPRRAITMAEDDPT